jgi:carboxymethylenebutenolidase
MAGKFVTIRAEDGGEFRAYVAKPEKGSGPGLVLLQEIFGVNQHMRDVADLYAEEGYVVLAPDLYWRVEPGIALPHDEAGLQQALGYMQQLDRAQAVHDAGAALDHLRRLPQVSGRVGVMGFCLGGMIGYLVAAQYHPDAAVLYYPSGVAGALNLAEKITCPTLVHFGDADSYLPAEQREAAMRAFESRPNVEVHVHRGAGHAFDNYLAPMFHHPEAREEAWPQTLAFLDRHLPVSQEAEPPALR